MYRWAVVACDQFTGNPAYWEEVARLTDGVPSTFHTTFPEIYLSRDNAPVIERINRRMREYLDGNLFTEYKNCAFLVDRATPYNPRRLGLMLSVDLEAYSFNPADKALIRASEGTILERIPPRVRIRQNAPLELPHIMLLLDDPERTVIEPLFEAVTGSGEKPVYDFDLNMGGGHVRAWSVDALPGIEAALAALLKPETLAAKYGTSESILFAVGDGNHSLATAKACWDIIKQGLSDAERENHPARFALCEAVNIYDEGIKFEPIHRVVFGVDPAAFKAGLPEPAAGDPVGSVKRCQDYIDTYLKEHGGEVDYIHGEEETLRVTRENRDRGAVAVILPKMEKSDFFPYVVNEGTLPRKTFSMGEAEEKRYYLEARKIV